MISWKTTDDLATALQGNYIGEQEVHPKRLASSINLILKGKTLPQWRMFYYGERDEELSEMFGYNK